MQHAISEETEKLFSLAREKSSESRSALAATISDLFAMEGGTLSARERTLMLDILGRTIHDVEFSIRRRIGRDLASAPDLPRDLAVFLANDHIDIAYPILLKSPVLQDADLIEIVRNRTFEHQLAVAMRERLSEAVADALVETGERMVIDRLLRNSDARISIAAMEYLIEESRRVDSFREPILLRRELPPELARKMFLWVSAALRQTIIARFELPPEAVDGLLEAAVLAEIGAAPIDIRPKNAGQDLADALVIMDSASPQLLLGILEAGEVSLFVSLLERLTDLPRSMVSEILFEPGAERLAITCRAIGIDKVVFGSIFSLTRRARPQLFATCGADLRAALDLYGAMSIEAAKRVVRRWRRNPRDVVGIDRSEDAMSDRV